MFILKIVNGRKTSSRHRMWWQKVRNELIAYFQQWDQPFLSLTVFLLSSSFVISFWWIVNKFEKKTPKRICRWATRSCVAFFLGDTSFLIFKVWVSVCIFERSWWWVLYFCLPTSRKSWHVFFHLSFKLNSSNFQRHAIVCILISRSDPFSKIEFNFVVSSLWDKYNHISWKDVFVYFWMGRLFPSDKKKTNEIDEYLNSYALFYLQIKTNAQHSWIHIQFNSFRVFFCEWSDSVDFSTKKNQFILKCGRFSTWASNQSMNFNK